MVTSMDMQMKWIYYSNGKTAKCARCGRITYSWCYYSLSRLNTQQRIAAMANADMFPYCRHCYDDEARILYDQRNIIYLQQQKENRKEYKEREQQAFERREQERLANKEKLMRTFFIRSTYYDEGLMQMTCKICSNKCVGAHYNRAWDGVTFCQSCLPKDAEIKTDRLSHYTGD